MFAALRSSGSLQLVRAAAAASASTSTSSSASTSSSVAAVAAGGVMGRAMMGAAAQTAAAPTAWMAAALPRHFATLTSTASSKDASTTTSTSTAENAAKTDAKTDANAAADNALEALKKQLADKEKLLADTKAQIDSLNDKYRRALAETENVRERGRRDAATAKEFGIQAFSKDLLEVVDLMHMAHESIPKETLEKHDNESPLRTLHEGVNMIHTSFAKVLKKHGVERFEPHGEKFNPNDHLAAFEMPHTEGGPASGHVGAVARAGFKLQSRVLRPAQVGVVRAQKK